MSDDDSGDPYLTTPELYMRMGAERERKRIRRAFWAQLKGFIGPATKLDIMEFVDAATRRPRKRK